MTPAHEFRVGDHCLPRRFEIITVPTLRSAHSGILLALAFWLCAALLVGSSLVPIAFVYRWADGVYGHDVIARHLSPAFYQALVSKLRILALVLAGFGVAFWKLRQTVSRRFSWGFRLMTGSLRREWHRERVFVTTALKGQACLLSLLLASAALLRLVFLHIPLRGDEATTYVYYGRKPLLLGISTYTLPNNHLFHTALVHLSTMLFGTAEWAIRLPALLAGCIMTVLLAYAALRFWGKFEALIAMALCAGSSVWIEYSVNARGYTLASCCFLVVLVAVSHVVERASPAWFLVWAVASAVGLYTIPAFLIQEISAVLWGVAMAWHSRPRLRRLLLRRGAITAVCTGVATVLLYLPPLLITGPGSLMANEYVRPVGWPEFVGWTSTELTRVWSLTHRDLPAPATAACVILAGLGIAFHSTVYRFRLLLASVFFSAAVFLVLRLPVPWRVWLVFTPLYLLAVAAGLSRLASRIFSRDRRDGLTAPLALGLTLALGAAVVLNWGVTRVPGDTGVIDDTPRIVNHCLNRKIPAEALLTESAASALRYYWWRKTGDDVDFTRTGANPAGRRDAWCLVNLRRQETIGEVLALHGLSASTVLESRRFEHMVLYQVRLATPERL